MNPQPHLRRAAPYLFPALLVTVLIAWPAPARPTPARGTIPHTARIVSNAIEHVAHDVGQLAR